MAQPPAKGVTLAVDADKIKLPQDALLPGTSPTIAEVADAYGRTTQRFGSVTAIAPPTMVVLNTAPGEPNIYAGMPALDAFTLLCAGLSDAQWQALTSEGGLGIADINTPQQRQLLAALLSRDGKLIVRPQYAAGEKWDDKDKRDLTDALPQTRLRLGQAITFDLPVKDEPDSSFPGAEVPPQGISRQYKVDDRQDYGGSSETVYGATVRAEVPNVPKRGQLDFSADGLQTAIPLSDLKTVGALVYRIGNATHTELYVDKRLESMTLTLRGTDTALAADLLQALAFCLTGTYRQVGPAYVLTDDVIGIGTRHQIWADFEREADDLRRRPVTEAANAIYTRHSPRALSWFGDPTAYSPDEEKAKDIDTIDVGQGALPSLQRPLSQLTPAQQDVVRRSVEDFNKEHTTQQATTDGKINVRPGLSVQLLVPGIDNPIDMNINGGSIDQSFLWQAPREVSDAALAAFRAQQAREHPEFVSKPVPTAPTADIFAMLKSVPRRAVLVHPRNAKEVDADIAALKTLGLNELWLDVFSDGAAHIPGSPLSPANPLPAGKNDILTEALAKTKGTSIRVFATISLLFWGPAPPAQFADLNILGETSAQAAARWNQEKATLPPGQEMPEEYTTGGIIPDWPGVAVSPLAPAVRSALIGLVRTLAARPSIAGLVWRDTDSPGYDPLPSGSDSSALLLGYQETMRLTFLRKSHADPIDIIPSGVYTKANTNLPNFSMEHFLTAHTNQELNGEWRAFRSDVGQGLLRALSAAATTPDGARLPLLLRQRRRGQGGTDGTGHHVYPPGWYGSWDNPNLPPPTLHSQGEDAEPGKPSQNVPDDMTQAKSQSRAVLVPISSPDFEAMRTNLNRPGMRSYFIAHPMPGFVLDLETDSLPDGKPNVDPLVALAESTGTATHGHAKP